MLKKNLKKTFICSLHLIISFLFLYNTSDAQYTIIRQNKEIVTNDTNFVSKIMETPPVRIPSSCSLPPRENRQFWSSLGRPMWMGSDERKINNDSVSQAKTYICHDNGYIRHEQQIDINTNAEIYCDTASCFGSECENFWQDNNIKLSVIDSNKIEINSPNNVSVEIYEAYKFLDSYIDKFSISGSSSNYPYNFNLEDNVTYIVVFKNSENDVVNIKKIRR